MKSFSSIIDPIHIENSSSVFGKFLNDERDVPFVKLILKIIFFMLPFAIILFFPMPKWMFWSLSAVYIIITNTRVKGPYILMLHCTSHRSLFKPKYKWMNNIIPVFLGPFFGQTPHTYFVHHMGMHHVENNMDNDLSSTIHFQRDSFFDFVKYFSKFFFVDFFSLVKYMHKKKWIKMRNKLIWGELSFYALCIVLGFFVNPWATFVVFVLQFVISRIIMMMGNWTQHSFVDKTDPNNCYKNSITCINTPYNKMCWNDGYHIDHHLKPAMHWTNYPKHFQENINEFAKNKAIVFDNLDYFQIWWLLMTKNYNKLGKAVVNINQIFSSETDAINLLKERTRKF
jgi:fatty acid desaturase